MTLTQQRQGRRAIAFLLALVMACAWLLVGGMRVAWADGDKQLTQENTRFMSVQYDGDPKNPVVEWTNDGQTWITLERGTDYSIDESTDHDKTEPGKYATKITGLGDYAASAPYEGTWCIRNANNLVVTIDNYTEGGTVSQPRVIADYGSATAEFYWSSEGSTMLTGIQPTTAGNYVVHAIIEPGDTYESAIATYSFTIYPSVLITPPTPILGLIYKKNPQDLINAGEVIADAWLLYSPTETGDYKSSIPTGTDAKSYDVWYKVVKGDEVLVAPTKLTTTIAPKPVSLSWTNTSFAYDGKNHAPTASVIGLLPNDTCTVTVSNPAKDAGTHKATAKTDSLSNKNYQLLGDATCEFTIKPLEAKLAWTNTTLTYNGKSQVPTATVSNLVGTDKCTVTVSNAQTNAGTYKATVSVSGLSNSNYSLSSAVTQEYKIAPLEAKLAWSNTTFKYDGKSHVPTATVSNLVKVSGKTDTCTVTVSGAQTKAGSYKATATALSNKNYKLPSVTTCDFTITGDTPSTSKPVFRLYNPNTGEHFYTVDSSEASAIQTVGWKLESSNAWLAAPDSSKGIPVYRLYNPNDGGDHHYTTKTAERDGLKKVGWIDEGISFYAPTVGVPVYREYNPNVIARNHNFTASITEHQTLVRYGWKNEGVAWYGMASAS